MNIGIIGGGSIGLLLGAYLGRYHSIHMYTRSEDQCHQLNRNGITCNTLEGPTIVTASRAASGIGAHDLLFVTVKQYQLEDVLQLNFHGHSPMVFLQNGMSHLEQLPIDTHVCLAGVVEHGAVKVADTEVEHLGNGKMIIANVTEKTGISAIIEQLNQPDFTFSSHDDYMEMLEGKLLINTVINPLTALFKVKNKEVVDNPFIRNLAVELCKEACMVLERDFEQGWNRVDQVAENTGENQSSMYRDLLNRRKTEIESICGYIIRKSHERVPYHQFAVDAIHALEKEGGR